MNSYEGRKVIEEIHAWLQRSGRRTTSRMPLLMLPESQLGLVRDQIVRAGCAVGLAQETKEQYEESDWARWFTPEAAGANPPALYCDGHIWNRLHRFANEIFHAFLEGRDDLLTITFDASLPGDVTGTEMPAVGQALAEAGARLTRRFHERRIRSMMARFQIIKPIPIETPIKGTDEQIAYFYDRLTLAWRARLEAERFFGSISHEKLSILIREGDDLMIRENRRASDLNNFYLAVFSEAAGNGRLVHPSQLVSEAQVRSYLDES